MGNLNDENGCATCATGEEHYEYFWSAIQRRELCQYDYRTNDGELFSTVMSDLDACRATRDAWLVDKSGFVEVWSTPIGMLELAINHLQDGNPLAAQMIVAEVADILRKPRGG